MKVEKSGFVTAAETGRQPLSGCGLRNRFTQESKRMRD